MTRTLIAAAALSLFGAGAALAGPQFSADTVQIQPGQEMRSGKLYVSDKGVRFEYQQDGQPVVQVMLPSQKVMRVMFPLSRTYIEIDVPHGATLAETRPDVPCKASPGLDCVKEGDDPAHADVQRWTIRMKNAPGAIRVWWDAKRKMAVREEYMDGRVMQATLRGPEPYEGRQVEGWEIVYMTPNGQYRRAISLYAPELGIAVVEQQPGGAIRELRNVQVGAPDPKLFALPENYKKVESATSPDAEPAGVTTPESQAPATKTNTRLTPSAAAPEPKPQQQAQPPMPQQMHGPGMMVMPEMQAPGGQGSVQMQGVGPHGMMQGPMMMQGPGMMMPPPPQQQQQQPQPQQAQPEAAAPAPSAWTQPRQAPPPQWGQPNGQPQAAPQPPFYPGYGPQGAPLSHFTDPGQPPAAQPAPQANGANGQPAPRPMPPFYPGYGMQPGPFGPYGPYGHPGFAPMQPPAPAPDKAAAPQVQPGAPATTSAKGGKEP